MKRKTAFLLALLVALTAAGCGSVDKEDTSDKKAAVIDAEDGKSSPEIVLVDSGMSLDYTPTVDEISAMVYAAVDQYDAVVEQDAGKYIDTVALEKLFEKVDMKEFCREYNYSEDYVDGARTDVLSELVSFCDYYAYEQYEDKYREDIVDEDDEEKSLEGFYGHMKNAAHEINGEWIVTLKEDEIVPSVYGGAKLYVVLDSCQKVGEELYSEYSVAWAEKGIGYKLECLGWTAGGETGGIIEDIDAEATDMTEEQMDEDAKGYADKNELKQANAVAKVGFNALAEFMADKECAGIDPESIFPDGNFAQANGEGISLAEGQEYEAEGDIWLYRQLSEQEFTEGTLYVGIADESYSVYDNGIWNRIFVQYKDKNGLIGQYPNVITWDSKDMPVWREYFMPPREETDPTADMDEAETLAAANSYAKTAFNAAAEYFADQETQGRLYGQVVEDGDFAFCASPEGLDLAERASAAGDKIIAAVLESDGVMGGRVFIGLLGEEDGTDFPWFVQWCSKDGTVGQYPSPVTAERQSQVCFGQYLP